MDYSPAAGRTQGSDNNCCRRVRRGIRSATTRPVHGNGQLPSGGVVRRTAKQLRFYDSPYCNPAESSPAGRHDPNGRSAVLPGDTEDLFNGRRALQYLSDAVIIKGCHTMAYGFLADVLVVAPWKVISRILEVIDMNSKMPKRPR